MMIYREKCPLSLTSGSGIVSSLANDNKVPWAILPTEDIRKIEQLYNIRSGFKTITTTLETLTIEEIASLIVVMYKDKWERLWETFKTEYNILEPYKITETGDREKTRGEINTLQHGKSVTSNGSDTGNLTTQGNDTTNGTDSLYGFNSVDAVPSDISTENLTTNSTETRNLQTSNTTTNSGTDSSMTDSEDVEEYTITKQGNNGFKTAQELIRENFDLWKNTFFEYVFDDIDRMITLSVY